MMVNVAYNATDPNAGLYESAGWVDVDREVEELGGASGGD